MCELKYIGSFITVLFILTMKYVVLEYIDKNLPISSVLEVLSIYFYNHKIKHYRWKSRN